jgi:type IV pilus assembly protein PilQ
MPVFAVFKSGSLRALAVTCLALAPAQAATASALVTLEAEETPEATVLRLGGTEPIGRHVSFHSDGRSFTVELEGIVESLLPPDIALAGGRVGDLCTELGERSGRSFARFVLSHPPQVSARSDVDPDDPRTLRITLTDAGDAPKRPVDQAVATLAAFGPRLPSDAMMLLAVLAPSELPAPVAGVAAAAATTAAGAPLRVAALGPSIGETFGLLGAPFPRRGRARDVGRAEQTVVASAAAPPAGLVALTVPAAPSSAQAESMPDAAGSPDPAALDQTRAEQPAAAGVSPAAGTPAPQADGPAPASEPAADAAPPEDEESGRDVAPVAVAAPAEQDAMPRGEVPLPVVAGDEPTMGHDEPAADGPKVPVSPDPPRKDEEEAPGGGSDGDLTVESAPSVDEAPRKPDDATSGQESEATSIPPAAAGELADRVPPGVLASLLLLAEPGDGETGTAREEEPEDAGDGIPRLRSVRSSSLGDGRSLVLLQGDGALTGDVVFQRTPSRLRIDLAGVRSGLALSRGPLWPEPLVGYRVRQTGPDHDPHVLVSLDLQRAVSFELVQGLEGLAVILSEPRPAQAPGAGNALAGLTGTAPAVGALETDPAGWAPTAPATTASTDPGSQPTRRVPRVQGYDSITIASGREGWQGEPVSLDFKEVDLPDLFRLFSRVSGLNVIVHSSLSDRTLSMTLNGVPWDQALDLILQSEGLGKKLDGNVMRIAPLNILLQEETVRANLNTARELAGDVRSIVRTLSHASGPEADTLVRKALSSRGRSMLDRRTNTLIISDILPRVAEIEELLDLLDRPTRQVEIQARIVETTHDFSKATGISWSLGYLADRAFGNSTNFRFPRSSEIDYAVNLPVSAATGNLGMSFRNVLNTLSLDMAIQAAEQRGRARVISQPHIVVLENEKAEIESGVQIPIVGTTAEEIEVTFVSASLRLTVEPRLTQDNHVIMDLQVENNQPVFIQTVGDNTSIAVRRAETSVSVPSGGTTVIGGIYQVNEGTASARVPGLSRVPLLGWLFRNKTHDVTNDELLIFVTPRIVDR